MTATARCACGREWTGLSQAHCDVCHEHFSTVPNFDKHNPRRRKADGQPGCDDPATMTRVREDGAVVPVFRPAVKDTFGRTWVAWYPDGQEPSEGDS